MKILTVQEERIKLQIWDTAGQERFRNITPVYFRNSNGIVLVFDVSNIDSFENVTYWLACLENHGTSQKPKALVGNKIDLTKRKVSRKRAEALAVKHNIPYYETSALNNVGIDEVFE
ncbi:small GTPase family Rab subfamily protein [Gregarina niphandrodes]|uniref:Small GTPase family Rab subfamily protein n=1 Tax=Gregarina niphandrodes TaxID=110365 RepID=A0A023B6B8_GRENI|nr:small GTPase family Rab subfamily protein [Gregarina niphandrodes]EZG66187.1 small GTPase family Rab subfamily protein [Gregarina niphandrodes]|eukprot:XP_011134010.1 small GTPase family Rab subfamily protein [Gregarina niphandrodes]